MNFRRCFTFFSVRLVCGWCVECASEIWKDNYFQLVKTSFLFSHRFHISFGCGPCLAQILHLTKKTLHVFIGEQFSREKNLRFEHFVRSQIEIVQVVQSTREKLRANNVEREQAMRQRKWNQNFVIFLPFHFRTVWNNRIMLFYATHDFLGPFAWCACALFWIMILNGTKFPFDIEETVINKRIFYGWKSFVSFRWFFFLLFSSDLFLFAFLFHRILVVFIALFFCSFVDAADFASAIKRFIQTHRFLVRKKTLICVLQR